MSESKVGVTKYSWELKYSIVAQYMAMGSAAKVARLTKVPVTTINAWMKQPWWLEIEENIKSERNAELNNKLSSAIDKSLEVIQQRLEEGDVVLNNKTGQMINKPVALRDAVAAGNALLARKTQIEKAQADTAIVKDSVKETLEALKLEFAKWAKTDKTKDAETLEFVEVVEKDNDALHVERET